MALVDRYARLVALDAAREDFSAVDHGLEAMMATAVSDWAMVTAVALMAAELRGDHEGTGRSSPGATTRTRW